MKVIIETKCGTEDEWKEANPVLSKGERGLVTDLECEVIGDGVQRYSSLTKYKLTSKEMIEALNSNTAAIALNTAKRSYPIEEEQKLKNLEENQTTGVQVYATLSALPSPGVLKVSYKVSNDPVDNLNGFYHWTGTEYKKDRDLIDGDVAEGEVKAVNGGKVWDFVNSRTVSDFFYRGGQPLIVNQTIVFPTGCRIYRYDIFNSLTSFEVESETVFPWEHNATIVWNLLTNIIEFISFPNLKSVHQIVLFRNIDGKLVSGVLKSQYDNDKMKVDWQYYYRNKMPIIQAETITFPSTLKLNILKPDNSYLDFTFESDTVFPWVHNKIIVWNTHSNVVSAKEWNDTLAPGEVILFKNISNELVSGVLKSQYDNDKMKVDWQYYYRYKKPIFTSDSVIFPATIQIYILRPDGTYDSFTFESDTVFPWVHNKIIVWNTVVNTVSAKEYNDFIDYGEVVLFKNIQGKLVSGVLKSQYDGDNLSVIPTAGIQKVIASTQASYLSDMCVVDGEIWTFGASNDEHTNTSVCQRYTVGGNFVLTKVGEFSHNLGHCNSVEYNEGMDCLIVGNGSGDYDLPGKFFVLPNAASFKNVSSITVQNNAIEYDLSPLNWGAKMNVIWGEDNGGGHDIAFVITNDNKNIRKIQLGKGPYDLGLGSLVSGTADGEFNGTFRLIDQWSQPHGSEVNQGSYFDKDGTILVGLGHSGLWYERLELLDGGLIRKRAVKQSLFKADGTEKPVIMEGITRYNDVLFIGAKIDGVENILAITD